MKDLDQRTTADFEMLIAISSYNIPNSCILCMTLRLHHAFLVHTHEIVCLLKCDLVLGPELYYKKSLEHR